MSYAIAAPSQLRDFHDAETVGSNSEADLVSSLELQLIPQTRAVVSAGITGPRPE